VAEPRLLPRARAILAGYRFAADPVDALCASDPEHVGRAEVHLDRLWRALDRDDERFDDAVEAFVEMTIDVMRMQARYYRTGQFDAGADVVPEGSLYDDADLMGRRYLCGLYLAQIFWPNHVEKLKYFEDEFVPLAADGARVLEVGAGPGTYGLTVGRAAACAELHINDISALSLATARRIAAVDPVRRPDAVRYSQSDFLELAVDVAPPYDLVIFSEVLEHLRDPHRGLEILVSLLRPTSVVFFATATNAAFYDHTIVFEHVDEIERMLDASGLAVTSSKCITAVAGPEGRDVIDFAALLELRETA
jgi:2-polyprenyl-3-methyl-5-hydroxy-6-metoxy-1,4-benzoquinol methylase